MRFRDRICSLEAEIRAIIKEKGEVKQMHLSEMEINKARNLVEYEAEILRRTPRTWIQGQGKREAGRDGPCPPGKEGGD